MAAAVRLAAFNLPQIAKITSHDDMDLYSLGEKKRALYAVIPDNDNTFHFLVSILYAQAFQTLYYSADQIYHGALPCHVHFILDEFAAMPLPGYTRELATMRSRNISLPRTSVEQAKYCYNNGYTIPRSQLQPGDLIFWSKTTCDCGRLNEIHHVGVYVGAGKIVDASSAKGYVVLRDLWSNSIWQIVLYARPQG